MGPLAAAVPKAYFSPHFKNDNNDQVELQWLPVSKSNDNFATEL
jgi:hypothetical protein